MAKDSELDIDQLYEDMEESRMDRAIETLDGIADESAEEPEESD